MNVHDFCRQVFSLVQFGSKKPQKTLAVEAKFDKKSSENDKKNAIRDIQNAEPPKDEQCE